VHRRSLAFLGLVAVAFGSVLFVERIGGTGEIAAIGRRYWPVLLLGLALANLVRLSDRGWAVLGPLLAAATGIVLLLFTLDVIEGSSYARVWPAALALVGVALVLVTAMPGAGEDRSARGDLRRLVWLRGERLRSIARPFWYARITVLVGAFTLDLRDAELHEGTAIHVNALFGTVEIQLDDSTAAMMQRPFVFGARGLVQGDAPREDDPQVTVSVLGLFGDARLQQRLATTPSQASSTQA
jgi:hypothetical protein